MDETAIFANFGVDWFAGFRIGTERGGVVVAHERAGFANKSGKWSIKITEHFDAFEFFVGDEVEFFLDAGREAVVDNLVEVIG